MENASSETQASATVETERVASPETLVSGGDSKSAATPGSGRAEVDTSAPFDSVKEAVDRFGGSALWNSQLKQLFQSHSRKNKLVCIEEHEVMNVQEQADQLEKDLIVKERETLDVLKELQRTKRIVDDLKMQLHTESSGMCKTSELHLDNGKHHPVPEPGGDPNVGVVCDGIYSKQFPCSTLVELKQAKINLARTATNMAEVQASIETQKREVEEEKALLDKTCEMLCSKTSTAAYLQEELKLMSLKLRLTQETNDKHNEDPASFSRDIKLLISDRERHRQAAEAAKSEVSRLTSEIEQLKATIKATEIRCVAANRMEEAAKAAEVVALAQKKTLISSSISTSELHDYSSVILTIEEYTASTHQIQQANELSSKKIEAAVLEVERANQSKVELIEKVEEAEEEVKTKKRFLEDAVNHAEAANRGKLAAEEALRRWRSEHGQRRTYIHYSTKFKNSYPGHHRRDSRMLDLNGLNLLNDVPRIGLKHTLSIGEILSKKLVGPDDYEDDGVHEKPTGKVKVSLGQILNRRPGVVSPRNTGSARKQHQVKRRKFSFAGLSKLLNKESMKNVRNKNSKQVSGSR